MWFKNTFVYQIRDSAFSDRLPDEPDLEASAFHDCLPTQPVSMGLVAPHPEISTRQLTTREFIVWQIQRQERLLPGPVVKETLQERVDTMQQSEDRKVGRNERTDLKEAITLELLPRAFTRNQRHTVILDRLSGWLFVQCGSESRADDVTAFLRDALGELPVVPLGSLCQPDAVWSQWLSSGDLPADTEIQDEMALYHPAEDAIVKVKQLPWDSAEVQQLLANGYRPTQIMLSWQDQLSLQINEKSVFKRLRFSDDLMEQAAQEGGDSALAEWEASLHLMTAALRRFSDQYLQWCGTDRSGEPNPEKS